MSQRLDLHYPVPTWADSPRLERQWRGYVLLSAGSAAGLSSAFLADAISIGPLTDARVRQILASEIANESPIRELVARIRDNTARYGRPLTTCLDHKGKGKRV